MDVGIVLSSAQILHVEYGARTVQGLQNRVVECVQEGGGLEAGVFSL